MNNIRFKSNASCSTYSKTLAPKVFISVARSSTPCYADEDDVRLFKDVSVSTRLLLKGDRQRVISRPILKLS